MRRLLHPSHGGVRALPEVQEETEAQEGSHPDRRQTRLRAVLEGLLQSGRQAATGATR